ncbi:MAG: helix-turn-helix transcriptional regulator [Steroidobacteraceae bacterium]
MTETDTPKPEVASSTGELFVGRRLRAAREKLGMSVIQTSEKLHLDPVIIDALEAENFDKLGAPVYVRGHMKRYAQFLDEDFSLLEQRYTEQHLASGEEPLKTAPHIPAPRDPRKFLWPAVALAGLLVLALIVWFAMRAQPTG